MKSVLIALLLVPAAAWWDPAHERAFMEKRAKRRALATHEAFSLDLTATTTVKLLRGDASTKEQQGLNFEALSKLAHLEAGRGLTWGSFIKSPPYIVRTKDEVGGWCAGDNPGGPYASYGESPYDSYGEFMAGGSKNKWADFAASSLAEAQEACWEWCTNPDNDDVPGEEDFEGYGYTADDFVALDMGWYDGDTATCFCQTECSCHVPFDGPASGSGYNYIYEHVLNLYPESTDIPYDTLDTCDWLPEE